MLSTASTLNTRRSSRTVDSHLHLAEKYQLRAIGGSDFHGERVKPDIQLVELGLELDWLLS